MSDERLRILELIESGRISVEEGVRRLEDLPAQEAPQTSDSPETSPAVTAEESARTESPIPGFVRWVWRTVFGLGVLVLAAGGLLLARAYSRPGGPGLVWGWLLFGLGLAVMLLGWWLQRARWLYVRIREQDGHGFMIVLPIPLLLVAWLLRVARRFVPQIEETGADQLVFAMREEIRKGSPFLIEVDDEEDGEEVRIGIY